MTERAAARPAADFSCGPRAAAAMSVACGLMFAALAVAHPGSRDMDALMHFGIAMDARHSLAALFDPWGRPLVTAFLVIPAMGGLLAARLACAALSAWACWETWRLARVAAPQASALAIPAFALQPYVFFLAHDTMTEPMFALLFAISLRLLLEKKLVPSLLVMSLTPLARPEGFVLGVLWGVFALLERIPSALSPSRHGQVLAGITNIFLHASRPLLLLAGTVAWVLGGYVATSTPDHPGDWLFIVHNWPQIWARTGVYGFGDLFHYCRTFPLIAGPALFAPCLIGLFVFAAGRDRRVIVTFAFFFVLHSVMWWRGWFGSIGFNRYFACIAPVLALFIAEGLRFAAAALAAFRLRPGAVVIAALLLAGLQDAAWNECLPRLNASAAFDDALNDWKRDGLLAKTPEYIGDAYPRVTIEPRYLWQAKPGQFDSVKLRAELRERPAGTRILWDTGTSREWYGLTPDDVAACGYRFLSRRRYDLAVFRPWWATRLPGGKSEPFEVALLEKN